jgi:hypothetical protein
MISRWTRVAGRLIAALLVAPASLAYDRDNTDVITLRNGDRITGEIVSLEYGILKVKTSAIGTLNIEWPAVQSLASEYTFYVEHADGRRRYAAEIQVDGTHLNVTADGESLRVPLASVARIAQVETRLWQRFSGSLAVGYSFTKSSDISVSSLQFVANYRAERMDSTFNVSTMTTKSPDSGTVDRDQISWNALMPLQRRNFWLVLASLDRNEELGIEGRAQAGAAIGRQFVQSNDSALNGFMGISLNREWATGVDGDQQSAEGLLGLQWRIFKFKNPETSLASSILFYPSLTESGRYRNELNITLRRELIEDLTFDLSYYNSYDNEPPDVTAETSDYGIVTSLGYKF